MKNITAIGFDLFNTLITMEPNTLAEAMARLTNSLRQSGLPIDEKPFIKAYRSAALMFVERAREDGRETHNSLWISAALRDGGEAVSPEDPRISEAVEQYFSAFYHNCRLIPGTKSMLGALRDRYPLGLLSNFTHGPAAREILKRTDLGPYFTVILISGELGFRKPHPLVFEKLAEQLGAQKDRIIYVGDDPDPDIYGAQRAGIRPVWTTYVQDHKVPLVKGLFQGYDKRPDSEVPRISSWEDLFSLLASVPPPSHEEETFVP